MQLESILKHSPEQCNHNCLDYDEASQLICLNCGIVTTESILVNDQFSMGHQGMNRVSSRKEILLNAFFERFRNYCGNLVNHEIRDICLERIKMILEQKPEWGLNKKAMHCAAACLYLTIKEHKIAVFLNEVLDVFQLDKIQFGKMLREVHNLLQLPQMLTDTQIFFPRFLALYSSEFAGNQLPEMTDKVRIFLDKIEFKIVYEPAVFAAVIVAVAVEVLKGNKLPKYEIEIISAQAGTTVDRFQRRISQIHTKIRLSMKACDSEVKLRGYIYYKGLYRFFSSNFVN